MTKTLLLPFLLFGLGSPGIQAQTATDKLPTVYGSVIFGHGWEDMLHAPYGIYATDPANGAAISPVVTDDRLKVNGGGTYADGLYYAVNYENYSDGVEVWFRVWDVSAGWKLVREVPLQSYTSVASDLTYDPSTDTLYGCFYKSEGQYTLGTLDPHTGVSTPIADLSEELIGLAANREGELYGIGTYGTLYRVDKQTAALTAVGSTGKNIRYDQSATFDFASGRLLWAMTPHEVTKSVEICEIDLETGETTTLTEVPNRYELTGIFTQSPFTADGAPARPTGFRAEFPQGALSGTLTFSLPTTTFGGSSLGSGGLTYQVSVDGTDLTTDQAAGTPGQIVSYPQTLTRGLHYFKASASNATGRSPFLKVDFWAGTDYAKAVNPTAAKATDGTVDIRWAAPTEGAHGGYINTSALRYKVVRTPGNATVYEGTATECTDADAATIAYNTYTYCVTAYADGEEGDTARTAPIIAGRPMELPYSEPFVNAADFQSFTVADANGDGYTWDYDGTERCVAYTFNYESEAGADDWLITPPFDFDSEHIYEVSFDTRAEERCTERFSVSLGSSAAVRDMRAEIMPDTEVKGTDTVKQSAYFRPAAGGPCFIGVHLTTPYATGGNFYFDNLKVREVAAVQAPDSVTELRATAGEQGAPYATLTFKLPTRTIAGDALTAITEVAVSNAADNMPLVSLTDKTPGEVCSIEVPASGNGYATYTVVVHNAQGGGMPASQSVYVGKDVPAAVQNLRITGTDDGQVSLSWDAPATGAHGGYIDAATLSYLVTKGGDESAETVTQSGTAFSDQLAMEEGKQLTAWYTVQAKTQQGKGSTAHTDTLFLGTPYELPLSESFTNGIYQCGPWETLNTEDAMWMVLNIGTFADPYDKDRGLMSFTSIVEGAQARLTGPKFSVKGCKYPHLSFYFYHRAQCYNTLQVCVRDAEGRLRVLDTLVSDDGSGKATQTGAWQQYSYSLADFRETDYLQPVFIGTQGDPGNWGIPIYLDKIEAVDRLDYNLRLSQLSLAGENDHFEAGDTLRMKLTLANTGVKDADGYSVDLYRNGKVIASLPGAPVRSDGYATLQFIDVPNGDAPESCQYYAALNWDSDVEPDDNTSNTLDVTVLPGRPYVSSISATHTGSDLRLEWERPAGIDLGTKAEEVTEDFESYIPFTIKHFGQWTLYDGDKQTTLGIQDGTGYFVQYPNVQAAMAYQIFNPTAANLSTQYYNAHSGQQVAATFSAGRSTANDDWLISPRVDGAQTISFYAASMDGSYYGCNEQIEVLYSTTDADPASFKQTGASATVPWNWRQYQYTLPEGTKYFAIRCTSLDQYILFLDDITYRKAARDFSLTGYNVYRNGELLNATPVSEPAFTITGKADEAATYAVSAVYNVGESNRTPFYWSPSQGIKPATADSHSTWSAAARDGKLTVTAQGNETFRLYEASGRLVYSAEGSFARSLPQGVYVVQGPDRSVKVTIR